MTFRYAEKMSSAVGHSPLVLVALLLVCGVCLAGSSYDEAEEAPAVRVYLPRERTVDLTKLTLGDVAYISGKDAALVAKASAIAMGRAPYPGEKLSFSRQTIQARLANVGLFTPEVQLTGARKVSLARDAQAIGSSDFINLAEEYLRNHLSAKRVIWQLAKKPKEFVLVSKTAPQLHCEFDAKAPSGYVRVLVFVRSTDGKRELGQREVSFRLSYRTQQVVATCSISRGETITPANTKIEEVIVQRKPGKWVSPFGLKARRAIQQGAVILMPMLVVPKPAVLVKRNRTVRIKVQGPGWRIVALGVAMQNGRSGDAIRVRNVDSKRIIIAQVDEQGDVVPLQNKLRRYRK